MYKNFTEIIADYTKAHTKLSPDYPSLQQWANAKFHFGKSEEESGNWAAQDL